MKPKKGNEFYAIVRKSAFSRTLGGEEGAGQELGPFIATNVSKPRVLSKGRHFEREFFNFKFNPAPSPIAEAAARSG